MADNKEKNEDLIPAKLAEGEAIIPESMVESVKEFVEKVKDEAVIAEAVSAFEEDVISSPEPVKNNKPSITYNEKGVMSSGKTNTEKSKPKAVKPKEEKKVAVYSTRNVRWYEVGKVVKGYNILPESEAKRWLERDHIRLVDPEEIKRELDN